jgi:hypothetical protein
METGKIEKEDVVINLRKREGETAKVVEIIYNETEAGWIEELISALELECVDLLEHGRSENVDLFANAVLQDRKRFEKSV